MVELEEHLALIDLPEQRPQGELQTPLDALRKVSIVCTANRIVHCIQVLGYCFKVHQQELVHALYLVQQALVELVQLDVALSFPHLVFLLEVVVRKIAVRPVLDDMASIVCQERPVIAQSMERKHHPDRRDRLLLPQHNKKASNCEEQKGNERWERGGDTSHSFQRVAKEFSSFADQVEVPRAKKTPFIFVRRCLSLHLYLDTFFIVLAEYLTLPFNIDPTTST